MLLSQLPNIRPNLQLLQPATLTSTSREWGRPKAELLTIVTWCLTMELAMNWRRGEDGWEIERGRSRRNARNTHRVRQVAVVEKKTKVCQRLMFTGKDKFHLTLREENNSVAQPVSQREKSCLIAFEILMCSGQLFKFKDRGPEQSYRATKIWQSWWKLGL